jgi:hypothetical protein
LILKKLEVDMKRDIARHELLITPIHEERECLEAYGNAYREYMNRTSRCGRIPKSREK